MKKYKLIKKYPGVYYQLGDVVFKEKNRTIYFPVDGGNGVNSNHVENFPEFWQEVPFEKFTILSYLDNDNHNVFTLKNGLYTDDITSYGKNYARIFFN